MRSFLAIVLALACLAPALAQNTDVNAERVTMDRMLLRVIDGTAPMGAAAVWPQQVLSATDERIDGTASASPFLDYVNGYYAPVLDRAPSQDLAAFLTSNDRLRGLVYRDSIARLMGDISFMLRPGYTSDATTSTSGPFLLARPAVRFMGSLGRNFGYFLDLSNGVRLSGDAAMIARTDPTLGRTLKFTMEDSAFFDRYVGYVQYQSDWMRIRFGREALQYGFSPIDNFVHSIDAPMLDGLLIDVPYKSLRFTMTHSAANGVDTSGAAVPGKYIATHRLAFDPTPWLSVAVNDMIVYWGRGLDFAYLNPLAFFVSAGLGTSERSLNDNSMLGFDVAVRPLPGTMLYGALIVDDLNFATLGDTSAQGNQNKFAYQAGISQAFGSPDAGSRSLVTLEYARVDPFTFSHRSINASYTTFGTPVGYDIQPNSDRAALQLRHWFTPRTFVRVDLDYTRHGENHLDSTGNIIAAEDPNYPGSGILVAVGNVGGDMLRGDGDGLAGNTFLRGNVSYQRRVRVWFSAEWIPNVFTDVRIGYTNRNGGNTPEDFFFGSFEVRVGY